jgi:hypothetical protein
MKFLRPVLLIVGLMALAIPMALANPIDPRIVVGGRAASEPIFGLTFHFNVNGNGGGFFDFANASGIDWINLSLTTRTPLDGNNDPITNPEDYNISSDLFASNRILFSNGFSNITILFFGIDANHPGIPLDPAFEEEEDFVFANEVEDNPPFGSHFYISLNDGDDFDPNGRGGWVPGATVYGAANVPEPGTLTLLLSGILAIGISVARRRRADPEAGHDGNS